MKIRRKNILDYFFRTLFSNRYSFDINYNKLKEITITLSDKGPGIKDIEKAILASDIGITPANDGKIIRINFPPLTEERRKDLCKEISKMAEESKVAIRSIRRDVNDKLKAMKKNSEITEDDVKKGETDIQKLTDKFVKKIDEVSEAKEKEIMSL